MRVTICLRLVYQRVIFLLLMRKYESEKALKIIWRNVSSYKRKGVLFLIVSSLNTFPLRIREFTKYCLSFQFPPLQLKKKKKLEFFLSYFCFCFCFFSAIPASSLVKKFYNKFGSCDFKYFASFLMKKLSMSRKRWLLFGKLSLKSFGTILIHVSPFSFPPLFASSWSLSFLELSLPLLPPFLSLSGDGEYPQTWKRNRYKTD